jgi:hypothetical protein
MCYTGEAEANVPLRDETKIDYFDNAAVAENMQTLWRISSPCTCILYEMRILSALYSTTYALIM